MPLHPVRLAGPRAYLGSVCCCPDSGPVPIPVGWVALAAFPGLFLSAKWHPGRPQIGDASIRLLAAVAQPGARTIELSAFGVRQRADSVLVHFVENGVEHLLRLFDFELGSSLFLSAAFFTPALDPSFSSLTGGLILLGRAFETGVALRKVVPHE